MAFVCTQSNDTFSAVCDIANMADDGRNYLKDWREYRGFKQEELADIVGTTKAVISLLENQKRPLSDKWLRKFADALKTTQGRILDTDPNSARAEYLDLWDHKLRKEDQARALRVLRSLTGTDD